MPPRRFSYEPERIGDDLFCLPLPLHDGSPVNSFVAVAPDGLRLIDGGLDTPECQATLERGLETLGYRLRDVRAILITHGHTDHVGAAPAVVAAGAALYAHPLEATDGRRLGFDEAWLRRHGMPAGGTPMRWGTRATWPAPSHLLEDGQRLAWGPLELQVIWCPGHTPGLVCLYEPARRILFTTDHVMRRARTPISLRSDVPGDPLADFLASLDKLAALDVETVLPGHGRPFHGLDRRLAELRAEAAAQLDIIRQRLAHGPASAFDLLQAGAEPARPVPERYAISQVLARLRYLEVRGEVRCQEAGGRFRYALRERAA